jgi:hypothetical protein
MHSKFSKYSKDYGSDKFWTGPRLPIQRLSWDKKKANDFEWVENCADYYDYYHGSHYSKKRIERLKLNYNLYNGRGEEAMSHYSSMHIPDEDEEIFIEDNVRHHSVIDQIAKSLVGEQQMRPLNPMAIDASGYGVNFRKKKRLELLQSHIQETIIGPTLEQITLEVMMRHGVQDPYSLKPEEQQDLNSEIQQKVKSKTPKEIENFMRNEYKSPSELQAQKLLDYLLHEYDIKFITDQGFKHALITGEEIYYIGVRHDKPVIELVNSMGFSYSGSANTMFIEDGEWAKYEQYMKFTDFFSQYGDLMKEKHLKQMFEVFSVGGGGRVGELDPRMVSQIAEYDTRTGVLSNIPDIRTIDGQNHIKSLYSRFGSDIDSYNSIRKAHIVYKSLRKFKRVHRNQNGKVLKFWCDESYVFNKTKGDFKQDIAWIPEPYQCTKIGVGDAIYLEKGPIPYAHRSIHDPWVVKLPYVGAEYNKLFGNAENVAPIDLGKPWQYKFNVQMARIHEMEATDIGKILVWAEGAKPKDWSWQKFLMMMKYGKIAVVDANQENFTPFDAQIIKQIDLSTINDIAGKLQYLEFLRNQVAISMSYNPSRLGQVGAYTAVTNNQQNIVQSSYQTEDIFSTHNKIVENVLNIMVKACRNAFRDNDFSRTYLLDDMSIADLEVDWEVLDQAELGIKIRNSSKDFNNIQKVKELGQAMIQNGLISFPELIKLQWASSGADVLNIAEQAEEKNQKLREEQSRKEQEMLQMQAQMQKELANLATQADLEKQNREHQNQLLIAKIESSRFAQQQDIDMNSIDDDLQAKREQLQFEIFKLNHEARERQKDRDLELKKHKDELKVSEDEVKVKKIVANKPVPRPASPKKK